jgi:hypothetical protein
MQFESVNKKVRAAQLRATAKELEAAGFSVMAEVNWEEAEWLDPTPRERAPEKARRTRAVASEGDVLAIPGDVYLPVSHRKPTQRIERRAPRGTSVIGRGNSGRVLRQTSAQ